MQGKRATVETRAAKRARNEERKHPEQKQHDQKGSEAALQPVMRPDAKEEAGGKDAPQASELKQELPRSPSPEYREKKRRIQDEDDAKGSVVPQEPEQKSEEGEALQPKGRAYYEGKYDIPASSELLAPELLVVEPRLSEPRTTVPRDSAKFFCLYIEARCAEILEEAGRSALQTLSAAYKMIYQHEASRLASC